PHDQHQLIALSAPRPVLIGTARRDQWGDPHGSFRALQGASSAWELAGQPGFAQSILRRPPSPPPRLAYFMRDGLHGIHREDWDQTLSFLTANLPATRR
ncbi:MAG: alpha/beta hydrolase, partial [Hyphomonadaceae bacterium]|nr:alpha/beta hydrolase [Hyphomonadaceae bacterium]